MITIVLSKEFDIDNTKMKVYFNTDDNNFEKINKAIIEYTRGYYELNKSMFLEDLLRAIYVSHFEFYEDIGFEYTDEHHPNCQDFNYICSGYRKFLKEYFGVEKNTDIDIEGMQKIAAIISNRISKIVDTINTRKTTSVSVVTKITAFDSEDTVTLNEPEILTDAILITNDSAYKIILSKIDNIKTVEDIKKYTINIIKRNYDLQLEAVKNAYKASINSLKSTIEELKADAFIQGLKLYTELKEHGWKIDTKTNMLVLDKKIIADKIQYQREIYKLPEAFIGDFYAYKIYIPIANKVCIAKASSSHHCNIDEDNGNICLGDLEGRELIYVIKNIENTLRILNLDSAYDNDAKSDLEDIISEIHLEKEYTEGEVFEID